MRQDTSIIPPLSLGSKFKTRAHRIQKNQIQHCSNFNILLNSKISTYLFSRKNVICTLRVTLQHTLFSHEEGSTSQYTCSRTHFDRPIFEKKLSSNGELPHPIATRLFAPKVFSRFPAWHHQPSPLSTSSPCSSF